MTLLISARRTAALLVSFAALAAGAADSRAQLLHTAPTQARPGAPLQVDGSLAGNIAFEKLVLRYRGPGEEYVDVKMDLQYGDLYRGIIPAARMKAPGLEYYVEGVTPDGGRVPLFMTASKPARVLVLNEDGSKPEVKPEKEKPVKPEPKPKPKPKKKCKKGKKCKDEEEPLTVEAANPYAEKPEAEPKPEKEPPAKVEEPAREEPKAEEPPKREESKREEPKPEKVARAEKPEKAPPKVERAAPKEERAEPPHKRSELEEELAIYGAEDSTGVVTRIDDKATLIPQLPTVLTAAQLRQLGVRSVYDALDFIPGLTVSRDVQGFYRLAVRGLRNDAQVLFLLDGHRLNDFYDGRALANLPIDNLERIEVFRGPATAEYGPNNFLAVVNLVTRRDEGVRASAGAGLWESFDGHLGLAKSFGGVKLFLDGDVLSQFGYRQPIAKDALDLNTIAENMRTATQPAGLTNDRRLLINVGGGIEYASEKLGKLTAAVRFLDENRAALIGQFDAVGHDSSLDWVTLLADVAFERKLGELGTWHARLFYDQQSTQRIFQLSPPNYKVNPKNDQPFFPEGIREGIAVGARTVGGEAGADLSLPAHNRLQVALSAELASLFGYQYLTNYNPSGNVYVGPNLSRPDGLLVPTETPDGAASHRFTLGISAQDSFTPFERLTLQLGVRADLISLPTTGGSSITGSSLAAGFGPRAGVVFAPINSLALKAHYGRAVRAPTVQEFAEVIPVSDSNQGRVVGNPKLQPEVIDSVEVGFEYAQTVGDARVKIKGSGFFENLTNPIVAVDASGNIYPYSNRPQGVRVLGAEGEARVELSHRSNAWLNASFFRAEDNATVAQARLLTDTPQARLNAGFSLPLGPYLNFDATMRFGSERRNDSRTVLELIRRYNLPGYFLVGAALRTEPLGDHFELALVGQNVFNFLSADDVPRPDRITGGVPREGVQVFATLKADF